MVYAEILQHLRCIGSFYIILIIINYRYLSSIIIIYNFRLVPSLAAIFESFMKLIKSSLTVFLVICCDIWLLARSFASSLHPILYDSSRFIDFTNSFNYYGPFHWRVNLSISLSTNISHNLRQNIRSLRYNTWGCKLKFC